MDIETALAFTDALVFAKVGTHLSDLQQAMLRSSWSMQRQSYDQIADQYGYSATYLKHDVGPKLWKLLSEVLGEKVNKTSFRTAIERRYQAAAASLPEPAEPPPPSLPPSQPPLLTTPRLDWSSAADVSLFYGRQAELTQIQNWIVQDRCRLVAVLGMGGMGKSSLSVKLAQQLIEPPSTKTDAFQFVIWRSLRNAPPIQDLLTDLLHFLSNQQQVNYPETVEGKIGQLLNNLRSHRCLIILDNIETILQSRDANDSLAYRSGNEAYGELFRQIGETMHQSCLVMTSREKPHEVALLEGATLPVRTLALQGLPMVAGQQLLQLKGTFQASEAEWQQLIKGYSGNPLALKMISTTIQTLFNGSIADFLQQETLVFGTIRNLLEQQFERLSAAEKTVLYWLAINREPISFNQLRADIFPPLPPQTLIEVLETLENRSLIEKTGTLFSLQPVVMEYITDGLVEQVAAEIQAGFQASQLAGQPRLLCKSHALLKAQSKDYIRETQIRFILKPILERLQLAHPESSLENILIHSLLTLSSKPRSEIGYAGGNLLNLLFQNQTQLQDCDLSRLVIWQADFLNTVLQNVNLSYSDLSQSLFTETLGIVFTISFNTNGTLFATGDAEGGLRLWQRADTKLLLNLEGHLGWVWAIAFSPDGQTLASCSSDKTIRLWDIRTGECLQVLRGHQSAIWAVAFSANGKWLASGGDESLIRMWEVETGKLQQEFPHTGRILSLAFSPTDSMLVSGSADGMIRLWNCETGQVRAVLNQHTNRVWSVAFSADGQWLASGSADGTINLWQANTGEWLRRLNDHRDRVRSVAFSPDGKTLVSSSDDQTLRLWQVASGECLKVFSGHTNSIFSVAFNADGETIASGSADQTVRFWSAQTGRCLKTIKGYTNSIFSIAYSPDGQSIASGSTDQTIRFWDVNRSRYQTLQGHAGWVTSVAFHPLGQQLVSTSVDQTVRIWSLKTGQCLQVLRGHTNWVQSAVFSPDGTQIASAGDDRTIRLWSVKTGQLLKTLSGHTSWIWAVRFSPDGKSLVSSSDDQTIRIWQATTGNCVQVLQGHTGQVQSIAFSPDGQMLVSGSGDEAVRLWSVETGDCVRILNGHQNNVWAVAFSPDGTLIASGSLDQTVRLWEVQTGTCLRTLAVLNQSVRSSIAFNPVAETHQLATGTHGGTIQIWQLDSGECLHTLTPNRPYQNTNITGVTGLTEAQKAAMKVLGAVEM
ncbi:MAG: NACHT domain-containing protein [Cyanobacteria bacterium RM1_2_2]|nr:NACHT domain-containing protein [Cyanobacteria bacterium RM1_2_2]